MRDATEMVNVSIIILNYNTFDLTCNCISSIYEKTEGLTYEIVLVDNASTECSPKLFRSKFPNIILLESDVNLGFSKGVNYGLRHARGRAVLLLNSDTRLRNNAVYLAYKRLFAEEQLAAVSGKVVTPDGRPQSVAQRFPSIKLIIAELLRLYRLMPYTQRKHLFLGDFFSHQEEVYADWVWATFFLMRREIVELLPKKQLDETFFMYEEDKLWCFQFKKLGKGVIYTPLPEVTHYVSGSTPEPGKAAAREKMIILNEYICLSKMKSKPYATIYFILKSLQFKLSSYKRANEFARLYWKAAIGKKLK